MDSITIAVDFNREEYKKQLKEINTYSCTHMGVYLTEHSLASLFLIFLYRQNMIELFTFSFIQNGRIDSFLLVSDIISSFEAFLFALSFSPQTINTGQDTLHLSLIHI